jgi:hypothetical protein
LGNPHAYYLKALCQAHGRASETERVWVDNEGLDNLNRLKIQSIPLGKLRGIRVPTATKRVPFTFGTIVIITCNGFKEI